MAKSADAFRTISEVSEWLDTPAHVLRFWESKFTQVKPVKRAGGRRYYRPSDMELLGGIKRLLHEDGMTIKGVQKMLREKGVAHVSDLSQPLDDVTAAVRDAMDGRAKAKADATTTPPVDTPTAAVATQTESPDPTPEEAETTEASEADTSTVVDFAAQPLPGAALRPAGVPSIRAVPPLSSPTEKTESENGSQAESISPLGALYARRAPLDATQIAEVASLRSRLRQWLAQEIG